VCCVLCAVCCVLCVRECEPRGALHLFDHGEPVALDRLEAGFRICAINNHNHRCPRQLRKERVEEEVEEEEREGRANVVW
jgi:hypothetical protein